MKISLSPEIERLIAEKVGSGRYNSADDVVREGLELLQEREEGAPRPSSTHTGNILGLFEGIATNVPEADWETVPSDLSKNLDRYVYGSQKKS
jgi:hypothetical protein